MRAQPPFRRNQRNSERGYILLTLMLVLAMLAIAAVAIAPSLTFQVQRDREEELIHRGVQYSRAVRHYFKKFGRYPTRIEDLENTNNIRFLRKRYKDPITGKDFKLLHFGEVQMTMGGGIASATAVAAISATAPGTNPAGASGQMGSLSLSVSTPPANNPSSSGTPGSDTNSASPSTESSTLGGSGGSGQVFGGGPIVGVASTSKAQSIRVFNNKDHYNQWQFIYDPGTDRGGLLNTPAQPPLQVAVPNPQSGAPGNPTTGPAGAMGTGTGFGSGASSFGSQPPAQTPTPAQSQPQQ